jgi:hypothetical protein
MLVESLCDFRAPEPGFQREISFREALEGQRLTFSPCLKTVYRVHRFELALPGSGLGFGNVVVGVEAQARVPSHLCQVISCVVCGCVLGRCVRQMSDSKESASSSSSGSVLTGSNAALTAAAASVGMGSSGSNGKAEKLYVAIRSRPLNARELAASSTEAWRIDSEQQTILPLAPGFNQSFQFGMEHGSSLAWD